MRYKFLIFEGIFMGKSKNKSIVLVGLVCSVLMLTGCIDEIKEKLNFAKSQMKKIIYPIPECSDKEVIVEVNRILSNDALYGMHAQVKFGTILLTGINEETEAKTCKAVVTYTIDKEDNKISSFFSKVPLIKNVSKDRTISYTIYRHPKADENLTFVVNVN
jgi:hypothetical protein